MSWQKWNSERVENGVKFKFEHLNDFYSLAKFKEKIHFCHDTLEVLMDLFLIKSQSAVFYSI